MEPRNPKTASRRFRGPPSEFARFGKPCQPSVGSPYQNLQILAAFHGPWKYAELRANVLGTCYGLCTMWQQH